MALILYIIGMLTIAIGAGVFIIWQNYQLNKHLSLIINKFKIMAQELETLTTEVSETNTVMASAVTLLQGLKAKLDEAIASGNPAQLKALSDSLDTNTNALAAAITENTPETPEEPTPEV